MRFRIITLILYPLDHLKYQSVIIHAHIPDSNYNLYSFQKLNLQSDVEKKLLALNKKYLVQLDTISNHLVALDSEINQFKHICKHMQEKLDIANHETNVIIQITTDLKSRKLYLFTKFKLRKSNWKKSLVDAFLSEFTLSEQQVSILTTSFTINSSVFYSCSF
jgi:hypothetical protein